MTSLYKRATPRQAVVLRMIEGAVRNAAHAHPGRTIDDERIARSISKRAAGTLTSQWGRVLAAPRVRSEGGPGQHRPGTTAVTGHTESRNGNAIEHLIHDRRGAPRASDWRAPLRGLHVAIGKECGAAQRVGNTERHAALVDVLRMIGAALEGEP